MWISPDFELLKYTEWDEMNIFRETTTYNKLWCKLLKKLMVKIITTMETLYKLINEIKNFFVNVIFMKYENFCIFESYEYFGIFKGL